MDYNYVKKFIESYDCELLSDTYVNAKEKLKIKCKCGEIFYRNWNNYSTPKKGKYCKKCTHKGNNKWDYASVKKFVEENSDCEIISKEYKNYSSKMKFKCKCGNIFETNFQEFKQSNKRQCNKCGKEISIKKLRLDIREVKKYIEENSDCKLISTEYSGNTSKLKIKCSCGNIFEQGFNTFKHSKHKCPECLGKELEKNVYSSYRNDYENVKNEIEINGCKLLSKEYINNRQKLKIMCKCGNVFYRSLNDFRRNRPHCPRCSDSIPVIEIKSILDEYKIKYKSEYSFPELNGIHGKPLRFDIAIFNKLDELKMLLEYDGEYHYKKFYDDNSFETLKKHDKLKNDFCIKNNIKLLRISYKEKHNLRNILINNVI